MNQRTSQAGSSLCPCLTTLYGMQKEMIEHVKNKAKIIKQYAQRFPRGHWSFLGPGKRSGTELTITNQMDLGTELQRKCF